MTEEVPGLPLPLTGATRLVAIVGDPIDQAGSPALFNAAFRRHGIGAVLVPMLVAAKDIPALVASFRATRNWDGLVVTVPHKVAIAECLDELAPAARRVGAVNAIRKTGDGRLIGSNFDGAGFVRGLQTQGHALAGKAVLVIGAGGAGRAICHSIADEGPRFLTISDLDRARAEALAASVRAEHPGLVVRSGIADAREHDVVVNCSPPDPGSPHSLPVSLDGADELSLVVDIVLKPPWTPLLDAAKARGCATHSGIHMLEGQVDAVTEFFGLFP
jgi:shikimate dehydrogenase